MLVIGDSKLPILLAEKDVRDLLSMDDLIAAMEQALAQYSTGGARQPERAIYYLSKKFTASE